MQISAINHPIRLKRLSSYIKHLPGLVAYYPMQERSGSIAYNHAPATKGTLNGTITGATLGVDGKVGKAISFDGNDYITVPEIEFGIGNTISIMALIDPSVISGNHTIVAKRINTEITFQFRIGSTGELILFVSQSAAGKSATSGITVSTNTPSLVGVTFDYANGSQVRFYINGFEEVTALNSSLSAIDDANTDIIIGNYTGGSMYYQGKLQHLAFGKNTGGVKWGREVFAKAAKIAGLYAPSQLYDYIRDLSPVAYYPMGEKVGTTAFNHAPNTLGTKNGTVSGSTLGVDGLIGLAYRNDGVNDRIQATLGQTNTVVTNFYRMKILSTPSSNYEVTVGYGNTRHWFIFLGASTQMAFGIRDTGGTEKNSGFVSGMQLNEWYNIFGFYDPNGGTDNIGIEIYDDAGDLVGSSKNTITGDMQTSGHIFTIANDPNRSFYVDMDCNHVAYFDKILSSDEKTSIFKKASI